MQRAGNLNRRVAFWRRIPDIDEFGNQTAGWAATITVWADVRETLGKEAVDAGTVQATRTATVRIRRSSDSTAIKTSDRMVFNGNNWNIRSIAEVSRDREMLDLLVEFGGAA